MKIVKGTRWLERDFMEQLKLLLETNHVVEIDTLVNFEDREQFIKNMLIRTEFALATNSDIAQQLRVDHAKEVTALKDEKHRNKLEEEENKLREMMGYE